MNTINAIIVNYRSPDLTLNCVNSILKHNITKAHNIIVVENGSGDNSEQQLRKTLPADVQLVVTKNNGGFSAGINLGARQASQDYLLVLNPDTYFLDNPFLKVLDIFQNKPKVGLIGLDLIYPTLQRQYSARKFYCLLDIIARRSILGKIWPLNTWVKQHLMFKEWESAAPFYADWVMGTGFIVRRSVFERIGRMDEAFFLYMEDVDLCARIWKAGYKVMCIPQANLVHDHQRSSNQSLFNKFRMMHLKSLMIFMNKYHLPIFKQPGVLGIFKHSDVPPQAISKLQ